MADETHTFETAFETLLSNMSSPQARVKAAGRVWLDNEQKLGVAMRRGRAAEAAEYKRNRDYLMMHPDVTQLHNEIRGIFRAVPAAERPSSWDNTLATMLPEHLEGSLKLIGQPLSKLENKKDAFYFEAHGVASDDAETMSRLFTSGDQRLSLDSYDGIRASHMYATFVANPHDPAALRAEMQNYDTGVQPILGALAAIEGPERQPAVESPQAFRQATSIYETARAANISPTQASALIDMGQAYARRQLVRDNKPLDDEGVGMVTQGAVDFFKQHAAAAAQTPGYTDALTLTQGAEWLGADLPTQVKVLSSIADKAPIVSQFPALSPREKSLWIQDIAASQLPGIVAPVDPTALGEIDVKLQTYEATGALAETGGLGMTPRAVALATAGVIPSLSGDTPLEVRATAASLADEKSDIASQLQKLRIDEQQEPHTRLQYGILDPDAPLDFKQQIETMAANSTPEEFAKNTQGMLSGEAFGMLQALGRAPGEGELRRVVYKSTDEALEALYAQLPPTKNAYEAMTQRDRVREQYLAAKASVDDAMYHWMWTRSNPYAHKRWATKKAKVQVGESKVPLGAFVEAGSDAEEELTRIYSGKVSGPRSRGRYLWQYTTGGLLSLETQGIVWVGEQVGGLFASAPEGRGGDWLSRRAARDTAFPYIVNHALLRGRFTVDAKGNLALAATPHPDLKNVTSHTYRGKEYDLTTEEGRKAARDALAEEEGNFFKAHMDRVGALEGAVGAGEQSLQNVREAGRLLFARDTNDAALDELQRTHKSVFQEAAKKQANQEAVAQAVALRATRFPGDPVLARERYRWEVESNKLAAEALQKVLDFQERVLNNSRKANRDLHADLLKARAEAGKAQRPDQENIRRLDAQLEFVYGQLTAPGVDL